MTIHNHPNHQKTSKQHDIIPAHRAKILVNPYRTLTTLSSNTVAAHRPPPKKFSATTINCSHSKVQGSQSQTALIMLQQERFQQHTDPLYLLPVSRASSSSTAATASSISRDDLNITDKPSWLTLHPGIHELCGPAGSGKTQLALTACLQAARMVRTNNKKMNPTTTHTNTATKESSLSLSSSTSSPVVPIRAIYISLQQHNLHKIAIRLQQMLVHSTTNPNYTNHNDHPQQQQQILQSILLKGCTCLDELLQLLRETLPKLQQSGNGQPSESIRLIVLDSLADLFRWIDIVEEDTTNKNNHQHHPHSQSSSNHHCPTTTTATNNNTTSQQKKKNDHNIPLRSAYLFQVAAALQNLALSTCLSKTTTTSENSSTSSSFRSNSSTPTVGPTRTTETTTTAPLITPPPPISILVLNQVTANFNHLPGNEVNNWNQNSIVSDRKMIPNGNPIRMDQSWIPALGLSWSHCVHSRFQVHRPTGTDTTTTTTKTTDSCRSYTTTITTTDTGSRQLDLVHSAQHAPNSIHFTIAQGGCYCNTDINK